MRLLATLRHPGAPACGPESRREAVRAVVRRGREVLLMRSAAGDLKLPGGGVEPGESDEQALRRELAEEVGARLVAVTEAYGAVVELAAAQDEGVAVFRMTSRHYGCEIDADWAGQSLDPGEQRLGLAPVWLDLAVAVEQARRSADRPDAPRWVLREVTVLDLLAAEPT